MTKIIIDTTADFTIDELNELDIRALPLRVNFDEGSFEDLFEITPAEFYKKMGSVESLPTTSLLGVGTFIEAYKEYPNEEILVITLAGSLSGTNHSAHMAKEQSGRSDIVIMDTNNVSVGSAIVIKEAVKMRDTGVPAQEIAAKLEEIIPQIRVYAIVETLKNLVKGGRLSSGAGMIGSALSLKPIIMVKHGVVESAGKARGTKAAFKKAVELIEAEGIDPAYPVRYAHANNFEGAQILQDAVGTEGHIGWLGSVIGSHAGEGATAVAFIAKK